MEQSLEDSMKIKANGLTDMEITEIRNCIRRITRRRKTEGKKPLNWKLKINSKKYVPRKRRDTDGMIYLIETISLKK